MLQAFTFILYIYEKKKHSTSAGVLPVAGGEDPLLFSPALLWLATISRSTGSPSAALNTGAKFRPSITAQLHGQREEEMQREGRQQTDRQTIPVQCLDAPLSLSLYFREELMDALDFVLQLNPAQRQTVETDRALHGGYQAHIVQ